MKSRGMPRGVRPCFLIGVDVEGDNLWERPHAITTRNAAALPRFQELCERHGLKPTYLVNYEMAMDDAVAEWGRDLLRRQAAEIGMHLHAWHSPPEYHLTADDYACQPYLPEYPEPVMRDKIAFLTDLIARRFGARPISHRAGRWGFDARSARLLSAQGYRVDSSVTPYISWHRHPGNPAGAGGPDFSRFPTRPYFLDLNAIDRAGASALLELPVTVMLRPRSFRNAVKRLVAGLPLRVWKVSRAAYRYNWLRAAGESAATLMDLLRRAHARHDPCVVFSVHSSELSAGASPDFPTAHSIEALYRTLEALFSEVARSFDGATFAEFRARYDEADQSAGCG